MNKGTWHCDSYTGHPYVICTMEDGNFWCRIDSPKTITLGKVETLKEAKLLAWKHHVENLKKFLKDANPENKVEKAINMVLEYGQYDGGHHKQWTLDQVLRILADDGYEELIKEYRDGEDGPETYSYDEGVAL